MRVPIFKYCQWEKPRRGLGNFSIGVACGVAKLEIFFAAIDQGRPALAFLGAQAIHVFWTLLAAWLLFGGVLFAQPAIN
jgi:hypothetical protein